MTGHRSYTGLDKPKDTRCGFTVQRTSGMQIRRGGKLHPMRKPSIWSRLFGGW